MKMRTYSVEIGGLASTTIYAKTIASAIQQAAEYYETIISCVRKHTHHDGTINARGFVTYDGRSCTMLIRTTS